METQVKSAPPNIMFTLDNSGSMDWSMMAPEGQGLFNNERFIWGLSDNNHSDHLTSDEKLEWKSQWSGYNRIYYNPFVTYKPWAKWNTLDITDNDSSGNNPPFNADLINARSNPIDSSVTLNLHDIYYADIPSGNTITTIIVDNGDGSPAYTEVGGGWENSSRIPEWDGQSRWSGNSDARAVFKPEITKETRYVISGFWNCYSTRDDNVIFQLDLDGDGTPDHTDQKSQRALNNDIEENGICGQWITLFNGTAYTFKEGNDATVTIKRNSNPTGDSIVADAIRFVPTEQTVVTYHDILNAHYYVVDDSDNDGPEPGEVYLVNFVWTHEDSDTTVDESELSRQYFKVTFDDDPNNHEDVVYLSPVTYTPDDHDSDNVPNSILPPDYDTDGNVDGYLSDYDDFKNFANWFSFYRRRELSAKAAVGLTISDLENVRVGFKTLWRTNTDGGANQPVLPIKVKVTTEEVTVNEVVIDDLDNGFTASNRGWEYAGNNPTYGTGAKKTKPNVQEAWAKWTPDLPSDGDYDVYARWGCQKKADKNAKITVRHKDGSTTDYYNQRASENNIKTMGTCTDNSASTGCCGDWVPLGTYEFEEGTGGYVQIERHSGSTINHRNPNKVRTYGDAVKFVKSESTSSTSTTTSSSYEDNTDELLSILYQIDSSGGTPLRKTLEDVGQYFDQTDSSDGGIGNSPYYTEAQGGACQQTYAIAMTDGYWNGDSPSVDNADGDKGSPYQDSYSNTLADVAMHYYSKDLSTTLSNSLPSNNYDQNNQQHMVTFSVSFGLDGVIDPADINNDNIPDSPSYLDDPYFLNPETPRPTWPDVFSSTVCPGTECPAKIDDLWHAAVNGRGRFFSADNPESLVSSLNEMFEDISSRASSGASVSVNGDELSTGLELYQSSYTSGNWEGNVTAYPINPVTGEILRQSSQVIWQAKEVLQTQDWNTGRKIITYDGLSGKPFRYNDLNTVQKNALNNDSNLVEYLRGNEVSGFRSRNRKLGDIVHSAPLLISASKPETDGVDNDGDGIVDENGEEGGTIYVGANDGMLHAFNAQTGEERFAFVPLHAYDYLQELGKTDYSHRFYVDATPSFKRISFLAGDQRSDLIDNDLDGCIDGISSPVCANENSDADYSNSTRGDENYSDGIDNDGDSLIDEPWEKKTMTILVSAMKKGGRGIFALDVTDAEAIHGDGSNPATESDIADMVLWEYPPVGTGILEYTYAGNQAGDNVDNDNDGCVDGETSASCTDEDADGDNENYSDNFDNDGDGTVDEQGEMWIKYPDQDDDMGYSFSDPFIVRSSITKYEAYSEGNHPWVVIFGNGYKSKNGSAVLYVLDALTGSLIRKIDTGVTANNGLSTPAVVDVNNDGRVDYAYAGDLKGNMWKFDLSDSDPENWGVAYGSNSYNPSGKSRIDYIDTDGTNHDQPAPLFAVPNQPVTSAPDVMYHPEKHGYFVIYGTGRYLGSDDRSNTSVQSVFGIWDYGQSAEQHLGEWNRSANTLSNISDVKLLEQTEIDWRYFGAGSTYLRTLSNNTPNWYLQCDDGVDNDGGDIDESDEPCIPVSNISYSSDGIDNDLDGSADEVDENIGHAGWFFNLPYRSDASSDTIDNDGDGTVDEDDETKKAGERVIKDVVIRDGKAIVISFIPDDSPCSGGGSSIVHEMLASSGGRMNTAVFDINNDGKIDSSDYIEIDGLRVAPTGMMHDGMLHTPVFVSDPNKSRNREMKIFSSSAGTTEVMWETKEETGLYYWYER